MKPMPFSIDRKYKLNLPKRPKKDRFPGSDEPFKATNPTYSHYRDSNIGIKGIVLVVRPRSAWCSVSLYLGRSKEENKALFDWLFKRKEDIEKKYGDALILSLIHI